MNLKNKFIYLPRFKRDYKKLSSSSQKRVKKALFQMERDLKYPSLKVKKIKGTRDIWEARASDTIRITFNLSGNTIILRTVGKHDILRNL